MPSHKQSVSKMMYTVLSFCILLINVPKVTTFVEDELDVTVDQVHNWAKKFGNEINIGSQRATCYDKSTIIIMRWAQNLLTEMCPKYWRKW